jgi:hypothetical protein
MFYAYVTYMNSKKADVSLCELLNYRLVRSRAGQQQELILMRYTVQFACSFASCASVFFPAPMHVLCSSWSGDTRPMSQNNDMILDGVHFRIQYVCKQPSSRRRKQPRVYDHGHGQSIKIQSTIILPSRLSQCHLLALLFILLF